MSIVTKTGDKGTTGLFGGERIPKDHPRIHANGTLDELNACLGLVLAEADLSTSLRPHLQKLQHVLFRVGADLATPLAKKSKEERVSDTNLVEVEEWITELEQSLPPQTKFLLPGGNQSGATLHMARTICRRAERWIVTLTRSERVNPDILPFINRLSDYLFLAARKTILDGGGKEIEVEY